MLVINKWILVLAINLWIFVLAINANLIRLLLHCTQLLYFVRSPRTCLEKMICEYLNRK